MNEDAVSVLKTLLPSVILSNPDSTNISSSLSERPPSGPITNNIVSLIDIFDNILLIVFSCEKFPPGIRYYNADYYLN